MSNVHPIFESIWEGICPHSPEKSKDTIALESFGEWLMKWYKPSDTERNRFYHVSEHGKPLPELLTISECSALWAAEYIPQLPALAPVSSHVDLQRIAEEEATFRYPSDNVKRRAFMAGVFYLAAQKQETITALTTVDL